MPGLSSDMNVRLGEVKSGVRLALVTVAAILLVSSLFIGLRLVEASTRSGLPFGILIVVFVAAVLWLTVARWAKWFFAACCLFTLRAATCFVLGRTISVPSIVASRPLFLGLSAVFAAMAVLSYRFVDTEPNRVDSICLVGAVVGFAYALLKGDALWWLLVPTLFLGISAAYDMIAGRPQKAS